MTAYYEECRREESRLHYLNAMMSSTRILLERASREDAGEAGCVRVCVSCGGGIAEC